MALRASIIAAGAQDGAPGVSHTQKPALFCAELNSLAAYTPPPPPPLMTRAGHCAFQMPP